MAGIPGPPNTNNVDVSGVEDQVSIPIPLSGVDDTAVIAFRVVTRLPQHGVLKDTNGNVLSVGSVLPATGNAANVLFYPDANWHGVTDFLYQARDNLGLLDTTPATVTITVTPVNDPPESYDTSASGVEDVAQILVNLTGSDIDGTVASFVIKDLPANGVLKTTGGVVLNIGDTVPATGNAAQVVFVPNANWNGETTFHYASKDNENLVDATPATATITVTPVAEPPETYDTAASGAEDAAQILVSLTGSDVDGTVTSFTIKDLPANGVLKTTGGVVLNVGDTVPAVGNAAQVVFVPNANWNGETTFHYASKDDENLDDATPATATITVTPVNDPPESYDTSASGAEDAAQILVDLTGSDVDGTVTSFTIVDLPLNGVLKTTGGVVLNVGDTVPAVGNAAQVVFVPNQDWNGQTTFHYASKDNENLDDATPATATITVTPVVDPPETDDTAASGPEDTPLAINLTGSDVDGTVVSFTIKSLPANGVLKDGNGNVLSVGSVVPASGNAATVTFYPDAQWSGQTTFDYASHDSDNLDDATPATATITIDPVNDPPETVDTSASGAEDTPITINLSGSDIDGTVQSFTIKDLPANGVLKDGNGNVLSVGSVVPATGNAATVTFHPNANWNGDTSFHYASNDNDGLQDPTPALASINVTPLNDPPETNNTSASGNEDGPPIAVALTGSDIDGTVKLFTINSLPANGVLKDGNGNVLTVGSTVPATGNGATVYFTPDANWNGVTDFDYASRDNEDLDDGTPATATITVASVNDAPDTNNSSTTGVKGSVNLGLTLTGSDPDGTVVSFTIKSLPANGVLKDGNGNTLGVGSVVTATGNQVEVFFTPSATFTGTVTFNYASNDNEGLQDATPAVGTVVITPPISAPDPKPPTTNDVCVTGAEDVIKLPVALTGADVDGTVKFFVINSLPANGKLYDANGNLLTVGSTVAVSGANTANVYFTPNANWNGDTSFNYSSKDNDNLVDATPAKAVIKITGVNDGPNTCDVCVTGNECSSSIKIGLAGSDPDGKVVSFVITTIPTEGVLKTGSGTVLKVGDVVSANAYGQASIYFYPSNNWDGVTTFKYAAKDNGGAVDSTPATVTVKLPHSNDGPETQSVTVNGTEDGGPVSIKLTGTDTDGFVKYFKINSIPTGGVLKNGSTVVQAGDVIAASSNSLTLTFTPNANWNGTTTFQYSAKDDDGAYDGSPATGKIIIAGVNDAPDAINDTASVTAGNALKLSTATLLSNDKDPDGNTLTVTSVQSPSHGTVSLANGEVTFTPTAGYTGAASFTYTISDGQGGTDTATVNIDVKAASAPPSAPSGPGVHSPSWWCGTGADYWDGGYDSGKAELTYKVDTDCSGGADSTGYLLVGDFNKNGLTDNGEHTWLVSVGNAKSLLGSSSSDGREVLGKEVVTAWLNFLNGNSVGSSGTVDTPAWLIKESVDWLSKTAGTTKTLSNGVANTGSMSSGDFVGTDISTSGSAWNTGFNLDGASGVQASGKDIAAGSYLEDRLEDYNLIGKIGSTIWANDLA